MRRWMLGLVFGLALLTATEAWAGCSGWRLGICRSAPKPAPITPLSGAPRPYPYGWFGATPQPYGYHHRGYYGDLYLRSYWPAR